MKTLIASLSFIVTASGLFTYENLSSSVNDNSAATILESLKSKETVAPTRTPVSKPAGSPTLQKEILTTTSTVATTVSQTTTSIEIPQTTTTTEKFQESPTTAFTTTSSPAPAVQSHIFYTSHLAYPRSKYIYCDTDKGWKTLSGPSTFSSLESALSAFPGKTLHEPCKE